LKTATLDFAVLVFFATIKGGNVQMRRFGKWFLIALGSLTVLLAIAITLTIGWRPFLGPRTRPLTNRTFERTPQRLERGHYIATALSGCSYCHTPHDWTAPGTPMIAGKEGAGDVQPYAALPGRIVAPNLTPDPETGAGTWTDDQLARAIREGVGHDGRALFPMMPYTSYRNMSDEDLASVVVYLRSLPAVHNQLPVTEMIFPVNYLIRGVPEPVTALVADADSSDQLKYGAHLAELARCANCHTPMVRGQPIPGMEFAGGFTFTGSWGTVASANITPDPSGISYYDEALFLSVLRSGQVKARKLSPIMPVMVYKNLTDYDLKAIFAFLRTTKAVKHRVDNSEAPTECKLCKQKHGSGSENE
jgi:mono/diheme cytochrome c family protein